MVSLNLQDVVGRYRSSSGEDLFFDYKKNVIEKEDIYDISGKHKFICM